MEPPDGTWLPRVLRGDAIGYCMAAIQSVGKLGKPFSAFQSAPGVNREDLEYDLEGCLRGLSGKVQYWIKPAGNRFKYGFYVHSWTLAALDFLDRTELSREDRAWIQGLLYGYTPNSIQEFIDNEKAGT